MWLRLLTVLLVLLLSAVGYGQQNAAVAPDAIFFNGKVVTVDQAFSVQQAFAVKGDTISAAGTNQLIRALAGSGTGQVDLRGSTVIPGLTDNHNHLYDTAKLLLTGVPISDPMTTADALARISEAVAMAKTGGTVFTSSLRLLPGQMQPTKADLDRISTEVAIVMRRGRRGAALLNTAALRRAGVSRENPTFLGASMPTDANGEPNGNSPAYPTGMRLLERLIPITEAEEEAALLKAIAQRNALGLTSVRDLSLFPEGIRTYFRLWQKGQLNMRVSAAIDIPDVDRFEETLRTWGVGAGFGDKWLRLDSISEDPTPLALADAERMKALAILANKYGWRMSPHTGNGDGSLKITLDAYEAADKMSPIKDKRWVIEHVVDATPEQMDQIKRLGVMVSATYAGYGANITPTMDAAARARIENQTPTRAYLDKGLVVSAGTDFLTAVTPDDSPFVPIYFNITRKTRTGQVIGPQHRITREEALRVSTINYAYTTYEEKIKGSLESGKLADFLILSDDIMTVPEEKILSIRPLATYVGGKKVFAAQGSGF